MSTPTGALSSPRALLGSSRLMEVGIVASAALLSCPAGASATRSEPVDLPRHRRAARQRDLRAIPPLDLTLLGRIEVHLHVERAGGGVQRLGTRLGGCAELAGDLGDPHRLGQEDRVTEGKRAGHVNALAALERPERLLRLRGEGGAGAAHVQVAVELTDVPTGIAHVQRAVGRDRAAQQQHRPVVHPIQHAAAADLVSHLGQLGVRPAGVVDRGERRAVRPRPVGQGPVLGDRGRQLALLHRRGVRRRRLRGRGRLLVTGQHDHPADDGDGDHDGRAGQHPALRASPLAPRCPSQDRPALVRRGVEDGHAPGPVGGRDLASCR